MLLSDTLLELDSPEEVWHLSHNELTPLFLPLHNSLTPLFLPRISLPASYLLIREEDVASRGRCLPTPLASPHLSPPHTTCLPTPLFLAQTLHFDLSHCSWLVSRRPLPQTSLTCCLVSRSNELVSLPAAYLLILRDSFDACCLCGALLVCVCVWCGVGARISGSSTCACFFHR